MLSIFNIVAGILIFFAEEWIACIKKIFAIPGTKLIIPLFITNYFFVTHEHMILWILLAMAYGFYDTYHFLISLYSSNKLILFIGQVMTLLLMTVLPVYALNIVRAIKKLEIYHYTWLISIMIWLLWVVLLITNEY